MSSIERKKPQYKAINRDLIRVIILLLSTGLALAILVLPIATRPSYFPLKEGDVAPQDIQAPSAFSYTSQVLTEQSRKEAEQRVSPVYLPADPSIARSKSNPSNHLNFISNTRADSFATLDQKIADLSALSTLQLSIEDSSRILSLSDSRWQTVQEEALSVLEQVMRNTIQESQVLSFQLSVPSLISLTLPEDQAQLVKSLVTPFIVPNSLYSEELTQSARDEARRKVEPVVRSFVSGV
jgi:membrane-associated HD superfamily phosphohydrolase